MRASGKFCPAFGRCCLIVPRTRTPRGGGTCICIIYQRLLFAGEALLYAHTLSTGLTTVGASRGMPQAFLGLAAACTGDGGYDLRAGWYKRLLSLLNPCWYFSQTGLGCSGLGCSGLVQAVKPPRLSLTASHHCLHANSLLLAG